MQKANSKTQNRRRPDLLKSPNVHAITQTGLCSRCKKERDLRSIWNDASSITHITMLATRDYKWTSAWNKPNNMSADMYPSSYTTLRGHVMKSATIFDVAKQTMRQRRVAHAAVQSSPLYPAIETEEFWIEDDVAQQSQSGHPRSGRIPKSDILAGYMRLNRETSSL